MFEKLLALRYLKAQKRHSLFTLSSIIIAMALMTLLFIGYSTFQGILRDSAYYDKPYHFKLLRLTDEEVEQLAGNPDFSSCKRVVEPNYTISAEIQLKTYHDDLGLYINTLFPEKYIYSDRFESYDEEKIDLNYDLVVCDRLDFYSKYTAVKNLALFFIFIIFLVMTLRLMIDTAFEISSKERERQYGMLQCMGAEPGQIVRIITFEGLILCVLGIPLGCLLGIGLSLAAFVAVESSGIAESFFTQEKAAQLMHIHIEPLLLLLAAVTGLVWVFLSAYGTGMRIIKMTPIQAITGRSNTVRKIRRFSLFGLLFGWKGKLATRNNRRQFKRFIITVVSLTLSISLFASFSVVLKESLASFEKTVKLTGLDYDMGLSIKTGYKDPLSYRDGLDVIRNSGYFDIVSFSQSQLAYVDNWDSSQSLCVLLYYPRETYDAQFEGEPPVSYDDLTRQNSYLVMIPEDNTSDSITTRLKDSKKLNMKMQVRTLVTDEDYANMSEKQQADVQEYAFTDYTTGEHKILYRYQTKKKPVTVTIAGSAEERKMDEEAKRFLGVTASYDNILILASTLDAYENGAYHLAGENNLLGGDSDLIQVNLKDENDYDKAKAYLGLNTGLLSLDEDYCGDLRKLRATIGAIQIGAAFLSVLIGLIALVNMVNILSTGILNRKSELAAMQCFGMTQGQLNAMTVIECLQYALTAGVLATALLEGLMYVMLLFLRKIEMEEFFGEIINFAEPLPRIWVAALVAFAAAVIASFIPLRQMQKESLTDQIRNIE